MEGVPVLSVRKSEPSRGGQQIRQGVCLGAKSQMSDARRRQERDSAQREPVRAAGRVESGQLYHQIRAAGQGHHSPPVLAEHGGLTPLQKMPAHGANDHVRAYLPAKRVNLIIMPVVKRVVLTYDTRDNRHRLIIQHDWRFRHDWRLLAVRYILLYHPGKSGIINYHFEREADYMDLVARIKERAKADVKRVVLPEGTEKRTVKAAELITKEGIARITLLGDLDLVKKSAAEIGADLTGVDVIDPEKSPDFKGFADSYFKMRQSKGMTPENAIETMKNPLFFGVMMVYAGQCHGMVAGAENSTGNVLRPALQILRTKPGISSVSGAFLMISDNTNLGENGVSVFADCAVNPALTAEQLAEVAYCSAITAKELGGIEEPRIAMLSFSTKGSASHESVDKVVEAVRIAHERYPDLLIDGELQIDAATVESVGQSKSPGSKVAGRANVFIFPSLESGNITYKAVQRFGDVEAIGPILQGLGKPVNDLSRGCSVEDIVGTVAMVCCQT